MSTSRSNKETVYKLPGSHSDVYSLGATIGRLMQLGGLKMERRWRDAFLQSKPYGHIYSAELVQLMYECLQSDGRRRPSPYNLMCRTKSAWERCERKIQDSIEDAAMNMTPNAYYPGKMLFRPNELKTDSPLLTPYQLGNEADSVRWNEEMLRRNTWEFAREPWDIGDPDEDPLEEVLKPPLAQKPRSAPPAQKVPPTLRRRQAQPLQQPKRFQQGPRQPFPPPQQRQQTRPLQQPQIYQQSKQLQQHANLVEQYQLRRPAYAQQLDAPRETAVNYANNAAKPPAIGQNQHADLQRLPAFNPLKDKPPPFRAGHHQQIEALRTPAEYLANTPQTNRAAYYQRTDGVRMPAANAVNDAPPPFRAGHRQQIDALRTPAENLANNAPQTNRGYHQRTNGVRMPAANAANDAPQPSQAGHHQQADTLRTAAAHHANNPPQPTQLGQYQQTDGLRIATANAANNAPQPSRPGQIQQIDVADPPAPPARRLIPLPRPIIKPADLAKPLPPEPDTPAPSGGEQPRRPVLRSTTRGMKKRAVNRNRPAGDKDLDAEQAAFPVATREGALVEKFSPPKEQFIDFVQLEVVQNQNLTAKRRFFEFADQAPAEEQNKRKSPRRQQQQQSQEREQEREQDQKQEQQATEEQETRQQPMTERRRGRLKRALGGGAG